MATSRDYINAALAAARKQGLSAAQVEVLDYAGVAALAGVKIGADGSSPPTFFWVKQDQCVGNRFSVAQNRPGYGAYLGIAANAQTQEQASQQRWAKQQIHQLVHICPFRPRRGAARS